MVHLTSFRSSDILDSRGNTYSLSPFRRAFAFKLGSSQPTGSYGVNDVVRVTSPVGLVYPARASNPGLTAPSKSWNRRSTGQQGNELPGIGAVSYEGLILWAYRGNAPRSISGG